MRSVNIIPIIVTLSVILLIDLYTFKGIKILLADAQAHWKKTATVIHWGIFAGISIWILIAFNSAASSNETPYKLYPIYYYLFGVILLLYLPKIIWMVFHLLDDLNVAIQWVVAKINPTPGESDNTNKITRAKFLHQTGVIIGTIPFAAVAYGILKGRYDFRVQKEKLTFKHLPKSFQGFKVVQISDAHLGSFFDNHTPVQKAIELVNNLNPDIIVFTGDLVNNYAAEAESWIPHFKKFKSKFGKYSIVGNHDYGDYVKWNGNDKADNFERLKQIHSEMGFELLLNDNKNIEVNGETISLLGVENWGVPPFPQKGDVVKAKAGTETVPFKILLSHDPSHWDAVIRKEHQDIDLTLSGHTHGMQFGVELGNIKWSPVKYKYPRWGGLYTENNQYLYVNRGFGYIGFPGRVGMPPEITLIELAQA